MIIVTFIFLSCNGFIATIGNESVLLTLLMLFFSWQLSIHLFHYVWTELEKETYLFPKQYFSDSRDFKSDFE